MTQINLQRFTAEAMEVVDIRLLDVVHDPEALLRETVDGLLVGIRASFFGRDAFAEITYPDGWVQAFRDRFYPRWAKARWPIRMATKYISARELFAGLPRIPKSQTGYSIAVADGPKTLRYLDSKV